MMMNWEVKKLEDVCEVIAGQSPEGKYYNDKGDGLPFYQGKKDFTEKFIGKPTAWTTKVTKEAQPDDILISVRAPVGPINFATDRICIGRGLAAIRAGKNIIPDYLFYCLSSMQDVISGREGAVFASINKSEIENLEIPLPPLPEQQRLVALLDEVFAALATAKENAAKNLRNARELFESVLHGVFANRGVEWEVKTLGEICEVLDSKRKPITKRDRTAGEYPYYGATGILDYVHDYIFDEKLILIGEDGAKWGAGENTFIAEGKYWVNNHAHVIRPDRSILLDNWIVYFLNFSDLQKYVTGLTVPKLNQEKMRGIILPLPPLPEQRAIVAKLDALSTETKKLEAIYQQKLANLEELKQSVLRKAFKGEI